MKYFFDTQETIPEGMGFGQFTLSHICWILAMLAFIAASVFVYRRLDPARRKKMQTLYAVLIVANEVVKTVALLIGGNYLAKYLPVHLCSINIFVVAFHAWKPLKAVGNYLYLVCIPAALIPLFTPTWAMLPNVNLMAWHSFTVHAFLVAYPLMLTVGGDIRPRLKTVPASLGVLTLLAGVALIVNLALDTNFMFLMYADPGNPLYLFKELWGSHLLGFPVIITGVLLVMHTPWLIAKKIKK
jgi:hypothetical integral membrane protein (TIGR02206 family)